MPNPVRRIALFAASLTAVLVATVVATPAQDAAKIKQGKDIFTAGAEPACAICHTLADAGATGEVGINLDDLKPKADRVRAAVRDGVGAMPAYGETLSKEQIDAVAQYVASAASK